MGDVESRGNGSIAGTCPLLATQLLSVFPSHTFELPYNTMIIATHQGRADFVISKDVFTVPQMRMHTVPGATVFLLDYITSSNFIIALLSVRHLNTKIHFIKLIFSNLHIRSK